MADRFPKKVRSRIMSRIRSKDTKPEIAVRRILWRSGLRYRIHDRAVLGIPDISNRRRKLAVFVDGCFWHGCPACYREPKTNKDYWRDKVRKNRRRREAVRTGLGAQGFRVVEIWEHEADDPDIVTRNVRAALDGSPAPTDGAEIGPVVPQTDKVC